MREPCNLNTTCRVLLKGCECPRARAGLEGSVLPALGAYCSTALGYAILLSIPLLYPLIGRVVRAGAPWRVSRGWRAAVEAVAPKARPELHGATVVAATAAVVGFGLNAPADVWGGCEKEVCAYHLMFGEATRHYAAVRHPANYYSNLPSLWLSLFLLVEAAHSVVGHNGGAPRAFVLMDAIFGLVLFSMTIASLIWHASNCAWIHFIDLGLMYSVIAWFPIRCAVSIAVHVVAKRIQRREQRSRGPPSGSTKALLDRAAESGVQLTQFEAEGMLLECEGHVGQALNRVKRGKRPRVLLDYAYAEARLGLPAAAAFMVVTLGLLLRAVLVLQSRFSESFPTARTRSDLSSFEIFLFIASPALYPSLALVASWQRCNWGHSVAMGMALACLTISFSFQSAERLALDLYCNPYSWIQPTAALHVGSAITIGAGYVWIRSVEVPAAIK